MLPRTATACGTTWYRPPFFTIVAPLARSSVSSVAVSASRGMPVDVRMVTVPPTRRVDRVILVEDVAQDVADDFAQVGGLEIEDDAAAGRLHRGTGRQRPAGLHALDHHAGALVDARRIAARIGLRARGGHRPSPGDGPIRFVGDGTAWERPTTASAPMGSVWQPARTKATAAAAAVARRRETCWNFIMVSPPCLDGRLSNCRKS